MIINLIAREWKVLRDMDNVRRRLKFMVSMRRTERTKKHSAPKEKSNLSQAIISEAAREFDYSPTFRTLFQPHLRPTEAPREDVDFSQLICYKSSLYLKENLPGKLI